MTHLNARSSLLSARSTPWCAISSSTTPAGQELIAPTELLQTRDVSYNETQALAKEAEEALLMRNMQSDMVQQLLRRLAAVRLAGS